MQKIYSFLTPPAPVPESEIIGTVEADVVIAGAGIAGLCAALRTAELGASVAVLEKTASCNARGGHFGAANSKVWRELGVVNDKKELARQWIAACGNRAREQIVWLYINNSEEAVGWLFDHQAAHGIYPKPGRPRYAGPSYTERYGAHLLVGPKKGILEVAENICLDSQALGARYFFETPAVYLEKEGGRISAVIGGKPGGYTRFRAKMGVILATGDIAGDRELLEAYSPMLLKVRHSQYTPPGANTGDGHKMGLWAGGIMEDAPFPTIIHPQGYSRMQAFFLFVNTRGDRFMNEDTWCQAKSVNVLKQPGNVDYAYSIFDADWKAQMIAGMPYSGGLFNDNSFCVYGDPFTADWEEKFVRSGLDNGLIVQADTIEELAVKIDIDPSKLAAVVSRYNMHVDNKDDPDFGKRPELLFPIKKPPFFASKFGPAVLAVTGGLLTDTRLRVLDGDQNPISGLYAVGNVAGGLYGVDYPTIIPGNSHGRAVTWGYLAGRYIIEDSAQV